LFNGLKKAKVCLSYRDSFVTKKHLNYKNHWKFSSKLRLIHAWHCTGAHYWCSSDFLWFVRLHILSTPVSQLAYWCIGRYLHPCDSHLPFNLVVTTRVIRALRLLQCHCRIYIPETQTCLQALSLLSACNTLQSANISIYYATIYFESRILQVLLTSEHRCQSNVAFNKICCQSNVAFIKI